MPVKPRLSGFRCAMRLVNRSVAVLLLPAFLAASTPVLAQQPGVVDDAALQQALASQADTERDQRATVQRVLAREDARAMAARMGLSVSAADTAVAALTGAELEAAARQAAAVERTAQAGGSNTIVISATTLLLVLIIVILIAN